MAQPFTGEAIPWRGSPLSLSTRIFHFMRMNAPGGLDKSSYLAYSYQFRRHVYIKHCKVETQAFGRIQSLHGADVRIICLEVQVQEITMC